MGEVLESQRHLVEAEDHYRSALAINPLDTDALNRLAAMHYEAGRYEEALPLYRTLAEVTPCNAENVSRLTDTLARLGQSDEGAQPSGSDPVTTQTANTASGEQPEVCKLPAAAGAQVSQRMDS